jgi:hypothetical protein
MQLSWGRGFFRIWTVLAIIWVTVLGWHEYSAHWWWSDPVFHVGGECWDRLAKWQDGKAFGPWDDAPDTPPGSAEITEADRWRELVRQKLTACEGAKPIVERLNGWVADNYTSIRDSILLIFLPPFGLLLLGYCIGWIVKGFRPA